MCMKKLLVLISLIYCFTVYGQFSQDATGWQDYVEDMREDAENESVIEELYMDLSYLAENPMDINRLDAETLKRLPFLSDRQINNLLVHKQRYGEMRSVYELKNIPGLDFNTLELLIPFVYAGEGEIYNRNMSGGNLPKYGKSDLLVRYDKGFQKKNGYKDVPEDILAANPNSKYLGEDFYNSVRYSYTFDNRIMFGIVGEKDAGEPFMRGKGYDYYSVHLLVKDTQRLKTLAIGDYRMSFGQGLVVSNDFTPSRASIITQAERRSNGFRRHYSTNENDFFRGIAATLNFDKVDISLFYSNKWMDGTVKNDTITSIKTDGYHRLQRDLDRQKAFSMQTVGGNIRYVVPDFTIGFTALNYSFGGYNMQPEKALYNTYYFRGKSNTNAGIDYMWKNRKLKLFGETAISENNALATINAAQFSPASYISLLMLYRNYSKKYQAYYGNAFSQNSSVINEQGFYTGFQITPVAHWKLSAYADVFRFPWLKYGIDAPSSGVEYMTQLDYNDAKNFSFYIRYRYKKTEDDSNGLIYNRHRSRAQCSYGSQTVKIRSALDFNTYNNGNNDNMGWMISQAIEYKPSSFPLRLDFYGSFFDADNSYCSIYSYEKTPLYVYYKPSFYNKGFRLSCTANYKPINKLTISTKIANTHYLNTETIGTALETIEGKDKTEMSIVVNWKF